MGLQGTFAGRDEEREIKIQGTDQGMWARVVPMVGPSIAIRAGIMMHVHRRTGHRKPCPGHRGHQHAKEAHQEDRNEFSHGIASFFWVQDCGLRGEGQ
ncbi:MAG: hypothetical protein EBZ22_07655 [Flavobacteriia bacterium]|nr:hypothetical protein [Flavobacteriia bacterium]